MLADGLSTFLLLVIAAFRDDAEVLGASQYWGSLTLHPLTAALKANSEMLVVPFACAIGWSILRPGRLDVRHYGLALLAVGITVYAALRSFFYDPGGGSGPFVGAGITLLLYGRACFHASPLARAALTVGVTRGILCFSVFLIAANVLNLVTGYGFVAGSPRMFGTTAHPNYLGAQMAMAMVPLVCLALRARLVGLLLVLLALVGGGAVLVASGSRTGLVMVTAGAVAALLARWRPSLRTVVALALAGGLLGGLLLASPPWQVGLDTAGTTFDRGGVDTREESFAVLLDDIARDPLVGAGHFRSASESAFLRGWAAYGVIYFAGLVVLIGGVLACGWRAVVQTKGSLEAMVLFATATCLAAGGVTEGYLIDAFTAPVIGWRLIVSAMIVEPHTFRALAAALRRPAAMAQSDVRRYSAAALRASRWRRVSQDTT